jgi:hypothetical protein
MDKKDFVSCSAREGFSSGNPAILINAVAFD